MTTKSPRERVKVSARARILGWLVLLVFLAILASVLVTRQALISRTDERIDREIADEVGELRALARTGRAPGTGQPFTSVTELLRVYLQRNIPEQHETFIALVGGKPYLRSRQAPPVRLDKDRRLMSKFAAVRQPELGTTETSAGTVRYAAVPVRVAGKPQRGVFVIAYFHDLALRNVTEVTRILAVVGFGTLALATVAAWLIAGRVLAPVRLVRATAKSITESDLTRRIPVTGDDDISELAATFNRMLDRLEQAFATQRQLIDDAGHELRTPITIIRGHLEVMGDDPDERRETTALVLDELDRMSRMVDDLITLAKADRPDFLRTQLVDVGALTEEVYGKAAALAERDWRLDDHGGGMVDADRQRLTQAWVQLALNATAHTAAGDPIWLGSRSRDGVVELWVRDSGPGVPAGEEQRIFERFVRAGHDQDGGGLGLAIVAAVAQAHGGRAWVESRPGFGATFRIEIPNVETS